jgi:hypothetical protein
MSYPVASGAVSPGIKQLMCEDYLKSPCGAEVFMTWSIIKCRDDFTLITEKL